VRTAVTSGLDRLPGPITAVTPAIGLSYMLQLNRWLELYGVRVTV
jgi:asparagine synthase (glutamine-hydrolysing)